MLTGIRIACDQYFQKYNKMLLKITFKTKYKLPNIYKKMFRIRKFYLKNSFKKQTVSTDVNENRLIGLKKLINNHATNINIYITKIIYIYPYIHATQLAVGAYIHVKGDI